jgi:hypothetical protein
LEITLKKRDYLTNERLKKKFYSFFDLANYAIHIAKDKIIKEEKVSLADVMNDLNNLPDEIRDKKA